MIKVKLYHQLAKKELIEKKNWYGLPFKTINYILNKNNLNIKDIDYFVTSGISAIDKSVPNKEIYLNKINQIKISKLKSIQKRINFLKQRFEHEKKVINIGTKNLLDKLKSKYKNLKIYDHHLSHAPQHILIQDLERLFCCYNRWLGRQLFIENI